jgi:hypothetical protein
MLSTLSGSTAHLRVGGVEEQMGIDLRTGMSVVIVLLLMILLLLTERQEDRPRSLARMLLAILIAFTIYEIGPTVLVGLLSLLIAAKPIGVAGYRLFWTVGPYFFAALLVGIDLFIAYALISGWKRTDTFNEKFAAVSMGLSAVSAVLGFVGFFLKNSLTGFVVPASILFIIGIRFMPSSKQGRSDSHQQPREIDDFIASGGNPANSE